MILFFDLALLEEHTKCDPVKLVNTLKLHHKRKVLPKSSRQRVKPLPNLYGSSFLLNPDPLFKDKTTDIGFIAQYIRLAGRRDYVMYKHYGQTYLDLSFFSDIDLNNLKYNPIIAISQSKIHFKYEELNGY